MEIQEIIVPPWYFESKKNGVEEIELKERVAAFCLAAVRHGTEKNKTEPPKTISPYLVDIIMELYETCSPRADA